MRSQFATGLNLSDYLLQWHFKPLILRSALNSKRKGQQKTGVICAIGRKIENIMSKCSECKSNVCGKHSWKGSIVASYVCYAVSNVIKESFNLVNQDKISIMCFCKNLLV